MNPLSSLKLQYYTASMVFSATVFDNMPHVIVDPMSWFWLELTQKRAHVGYVITFEIKRSYEVSVSAPFPVSIPKVYMIYISKMPPLYSASY